MLVGTGKDHAPDGQRLYVLFFLAGFIALGSQSFETHQSSYDLNSLKAVSISAD
jgi:hypothetical protein